MKKQLKEVQLSCRHTECPADLHCFNSTQRGVRKGKIRAPGVCHECGADLVEWKRVHERNLDDVEATFAALRCEWIRHHFWHAPFNQASRDHAQLLGQAALLDSVHGYVVESVGRARHPAEGRQVPLESSKIKTMVQYAQHAVAACCRRCVEKWHGIPAGQPLAQTELAYLSALVRLYVNYRFPELSHPSARSKRPIPATIHANRHSRRGGAVSPANH